MEKGSTEYIKKKFLRLADHMDLIEIAHCVTEGKDLVIPLVEPKNTAVRICGQDGTVYAGNKKQLEAWKEFYLPEKMEMEVIGAIDHLPCDPFSLQLVLLLCKDGKVYAYEDKVLHLVAKNLKILFECGMQYPGKKTFRLGNYIKKPSKEEYNKIMESDEMKKLTKSHQEFSESINLGMLNAIALIKLRKKGPGDAQKQKDSGDFTSTEEQRVLKKEARFVDHGSFQHTAPRPCVPV